MKQTINIIECDASIIDAFYLMQPHKKEGFNHIRKRKGWAAPRASGACIWLVERIAADTMQPIGIHRSGPVSTRCSGNLPSHAGQRSCLPGLLRQRAHHESRLLQLPRHRHSHRRTERCLQLHAEADPDSSQNQVQECADSPCILRTSYMLCCSGLSHMLSCLQRCSKQQGLYTLSDHHTCSAEAGEHAAARGGAGEGDHCRGVPERPRHCG